MLILLFIPRLFAGDQLGRHLSVAQDAIKLLDGDNSVINTCYLTDEVIIDYEYDESSGYIFCILGKRGEKRGNRLAVYRVQDTEICKVFYGDKEHNPWKILLADVDGDSMMEVCVGVWKKTRYDPKNDNRLFIYGWEEGKLYPKWLGSRLSAPFTDFSFSDLDNDGTEELIALEIQRNHQKRVMTYKWQSFGFIAYKILFENIEAESLLKNEF